MKILRNNNSRKYLQKMFRHKRLKTYEPMVEIGVETKKQTLVLTNIHCNMAITKNKKLSTLFGV